MKIIYGIYKLCHGSLYPFPNEDHRGERGLSPAGRLPAWLHAEYGLDMSDQERVKDTDYAISVDGKVYGFPVCVEARGFLYNADAIKNTLGEDFDPASIASLDDWRKRSRITGQVLHRSNTKAYSKSIQSD